ncbi:Gfo/Idh/MocA family protein [Maribacter hydrothermalis]|uniref:Oxidoreductase n=1 Tax=Maribacter hydrothermalis TaxID=1836467 RepID=A0A1B7ZE48_9FLAO|nr:Gfo/Idh/MocA family oxidoreductase [Maribacter hydrothermalis]APQ17357.1 oxidoreductase [Maribacter hydrothermalis]OBR41835.1 oxidoreductase [Maribacter hydrothermalis]
MKVLIVGLGSIASKHIAALKNIDPKVEFYAMRSSLNADSKEGITNVFSFEDLNDIELDFAIISNPTSAHKETIERLIPKKIPLFIEKPLFSSLENEAVLQKIENNNIPTYVACNLRFLDCLKFAKKHIQGKRINEVNVYCGSYLPDWRPGIDYKTTYSANKKLGGGVHIDLIHEIDYAYWLFGKPQEVNKVFSSKSSLNIDAYDYANYMLAYPTFNANIILNYFRRDPKRTLEIVCDDQTLKVDILKNTVYQNQEIIYSSEKTIIDTYEDQLRFFIDEVIAKGNKFNTANEAYQILKICLQND